MSRILSKEFKYVPSHSTDIRKTFEKHGMMLVPKRELIIPDATSDVLKNFNDIYETNRRYLLGVGDA